MDTYYMYFPFFTCGVKYGTAALHIANRHTVHSMNLTVRPIIKPFQLIDPVGKLHRKILAFLISQDIRTVRFYRHLLVIEGTKCVFRRLRSHQSINII